MATNGEISERLARLEEKFTAREALADERHANTRRILAGIIFVLVGLIAWAAAQGFDLGGLGLVDAVS